MNRTFKLFVMTVLSLMITGMARATDGVIDFTQNPYNLTTSNTYEYPRTFDETVNDIRIRYSNDGTNSRMKYLYFEVYPGCNDTISVPEGQVISKVVFEANVNNVYYERLYNLYTDDDGDGQIKVDNDGLWSGYLNTIVLHNGGDRPIRLTKITVTYETENPDHVYRPEIAGRTPFSSTTQVTITGANVADEIHYTTDGTIPTSASTLYTGPFEVSSTTTVNAISVRGNNVSDPISKTFTKIAEVNNIAEFLALSNGTQAVLNLSDAYVTVTDKDYDDAYVQDATGAIDIYKTNNALTAGTKLNGKIAATRNVRNSIVPTAQDLEWSDITATEGTLSPVEKKTSEITQDIVCHYILLKDVKVSKSVSFSRYGPNYSWKATDTDGNSINIGTDPDGAPALSSLIPEHVGVSSGESTLRFDFIGVVVDGPKLSIAKATPVSAAITIGDTEYATMYYSDASFTLPEDVTATTYRTEEGSNALIPSRVYNPGEVVPAGEPVVLNGFPDSYNFIAGSTDRTPDPDNMLKGSDAASSTSGGTDYLYYMLSLNANSDPESVGFYWGAEDGAAFSCKARKAYLRVPKSSGSKFYTFGSSDTDGIKDIKAETNTNANAPLYNIAGQRVGKDYKGLVIQNGKKFIKR